MVTARRLLCSPAADGYALTADLFDDLCQLEASALFRNHCPSFDVLACPVARGCDAACGRLYLLPGCTTFRLRFCLRSLQRSDRVEVCLSVTRNASRSVIRAGAH